MGAAYAVWGLFMKHDWLGMYTILLSPLCGLVVGQEPVGTHHKTEDAGGNVTRDVQAL